MRKPLSALLLAAAALTFALAGCSRKTDATSELDKAAKELQKAEAARPTEVAPAPVAHQAAPPQAAAIQPAPPPAEQMNQAVAAYKSGDVTDAVIRLQKLRAQTAMTPQQRMALQDAIASVMADLYARAAKGDARAKEAIQEYQRWQTGRRQ